MSEERVRIGYTSPPLVSEVFPYEFYQIVPKGVTLALTTLDVWEHTRGELETSYQRTLRAGLAMAEAGVDLIVLGGVPVLSSQGTERNENTVKVLEDECGVPITTARDSYRNAFGRLGAKRVVTVEAPHTPGNDVLERAGLNVLARSGCHGARMVASTVQSSEETAQIGRDLLRANPTADTLWLSWPHRATVDQIEPLEHEFGVSVVTATQAIVWEALRRCGVKGPIPGFGRLLREHLE